RVLTPCLDCAIERDLAGAELGSFVASRRNGRWGQACEHFIGQASGAERLIARVVAAPEPSSEIGATGYSRGITRTPAICCCSNARAQAVRLRRRPVARYLPQPP